MSPTLTPVAFQGNLQFPADMTLPPDNVPFNAAINVASSQPDMMFNVTGSGSINVPFGTVGSPGAKLVAVRYDVQTGALPIELTINASATPIELTPGGFFMLISPTPAAGVTSLAIAYTASCQIRVWVLG
jgi:hypothetical protein